MQTVKEFNFAILKDDAVLNEVSTNVKRSSEEFGFCENDVTHIVTSLRECTSNIIKHAYRGNLNIKFIKNLRDSYIVMVFDDKGPQIADIKKAFESGYSSSKTLGLGMSVILRSMDKVHILPKEDGMSITLIKYLKFDKNICQFFHTFTPYEFGFKTVPYTVYKESGDCALSVLKDNGEILFAHWDISGHGSSEVYRNSLILKKYILALREYPLEDIITIVNQHFALDNTLRQISAIFGVINEKIMQVYQFGNIQFVYIQKNKIYKKESTLSILGREHITMQKSIFKDVDVFVSTSDGVKIHNIEKEECIFFGSNSYEASDCFLEKFGNKNDDASVLVIRQLRGQGEKTTLL